MRGLLVTIDNHASLNSAANRWDANFDKAMIAMVDLNNLLDEELGGNTDWGGKYASWLNSLGLEHETDNGWWNLIAIDPENIQAFIDAMNDEEENGWFDMCQTAKRRIAEISKHGKFTPATKKVRELIEGLNND